MQQAEDFREESRALAAILEPLSNQDFETVTQFKEWTINDVLGHLHMFNHAAALSLQSDALFHGFFAPIQKQLDAGKTLLQSQYPWLDGLCGRALFAQWRDGAERLADQYADANPKQRLAWAGPQMSARSSITARQMETWAHGHEVFDVLGQERAETDRIKNIVFLGVSTFAWTFINRKMAVPADVPYLKLIAPSGVVWEWNEPKEENAVVGRAVEFAQVVTQTRNIRDTALQVSGDAAIAWMDIAQCFAAGIGDPPAKGTRFRFKADA